MKDGVKIQGLRGSFNMKVYINGELVEDYTDDNLVVTLGKKDVARLLGGDTSGKKISKIQVGTNATPPDVADSGITNPFTKAITNAAYPADNQVIFNWVLEANEANGMTIAEFGLLNEDNVLFARKIRTPIQKVDPMVIVGAWKITIN